MVFGFLKKKKRPKPLQQELLPLLLRPSYVKNSFDCIRINNNLNRVIMAVGFPRIIREGWLNSIVASDGNFDISMFISPSQIQSIMGSLNMELVKQKSDMMAAEMKGIVNPSLKVQYDDTYRTLERLQSGEEKLFDFSLYVNARANSSEELELLSRKIESELNSMMIIPKTPFMRMQQAIQGVIPILKDKLKASRNIPSRALSACFPFTSSFLHLEEDGVMFGLNRDNNIPIILDVWKLTNQNGLIISTSGAGKSFFSKLYIIRNLLKGIKTIAIDPQGEYIELCKTYGGQLVKISKDSKTIINPLDLLDHDFEEKMLSLMDLFRIMCSELTEVQKNILDQALLKIYEERGIVANNPSTWSKKPPVMEDLYYKLVGEKENASRIEKMTYDALINRIRIYAKGSFSFMNRQTNLDLRNDLIVFDIVDMPPQVKPVMMYLVLDFVHKKMQKDKERKLLVVDEAWTLLRYGQHANYLFELIKTARKFGLGMLIITQEVNDLLTSKAGKTILANTAWKLLLRQEPTVIREVVENFNLNQEEQNFVLTAQKGEGLLFAMNSHIPVKIVSSEKEYEIITTNPDELRKREKKKKEVEKEHEEDLRIYKADKSFYLKKDLSKDQIEFLKGRGYVQIRQADFNSARGNIYLIEPPRGNESTEHYFLVELIAEEIRHYTDNIEVRGTRKPDIEVALNSGEKIAFEIETGKEMEKHKKRALIKSQQLNKKYRRWFFVVTNKRMKEEYEKYGETLTKANAREKIDELFEGKKKPMLSDFA